MQKRDRRWKLLSSELEDSRCPFEHWAVAFAMDHHETIWMLESPKHDQESIKIYAGVHVSGGFPTRSACTPQDAGSLACSNGGCNGGSTGVNMMSYQILLRFPSCNRDAVRWTLYCYQRAISRVWVEACQRLARAQIMERVVMSRLRPRAGTPATSRQVSLDCSERAASENITDGAPLRAWRCTCFRCSSHSPSAHCRSKDVLSLALQSTCSQSNLQGQLPAVVGQGRYR